MVRHVPLTPVEAEVVARSRGWRRWRRRIVRTVVTLVVVVPIATATGVAAFVYGPWPMPEPELPAQAADIVPTVVVAGDGSPLGTFRPAESRLAIEPGAVPNNVRRAVLAIEDARYDAHPGVDAEGLARAAWVSFQEGRSVQGGSTITQQLVKLSTGRDERTLDRKASEALAAIRLDRAWGKERVLATYLNSVFLANGAWGIEAASREYFGKPASELTLGEAGLFAGVIQSPTRYDPRRHPADAERRRQVVLDRLEATGLASPAEVLEARAPLMVRAPAAGEATRFPYFFDYVRRYLTDDLGLDPATVFGGGLRVETTLDPRLQDIADRAAHEMVRGGPEASVAMVEPSTSYVRALVGGRDYSKSQVNLALGARGGGSGRQAGSSFKTFALTAAYAAGVAGPQSVFPAPASIQPPGYRQPVSNSCRCDYGALTLERATAQSVNTVFIGLETAVGVERVTAMAAQLGVQGLDPGRATGGIALGVAEVAPLDMAAGYATLAAGGWRSPVSPVARVTASDGRVLFDAANRARSQVVRRGVTAQVVESLAGVTVEGGTGKAAALPDRAVAGKTGTTNDSADAWFVGFTPQMATAVWVGHSEGRVPMPGVFGGTVPAELWRRVMTEGLAGSPALPLDYLWTDDDPGARFVRASADRVFQPADRMRLRVAPRPPAPPPPPTTRRERPAPSPTARRPQAPRTEPVRPVPRPSVVEPPTVVEPEVPTTTGPTVVEPEVPTTTPPAPVPSPPATTGSTTTTTTGTTTTTRPPTTTSVRPRPGSTTTEPPRTTTPTTSASTTTSTSTRPSTTTTSGSALRTTTTEVRP